MLQSQLYSPFGVFNRRVQRAQNASRNDRWKPAVDIVESGSQYRLVVELPGIPSAEIDLTAEQGHLVIHAQKPATSISKGESLTRQERQARVYHREFDLPEDADVASIEATSEHGVLTLLIPRQKPQQKSRKIEIQS